jgi:hypothetical protein
MNEMEGKYALVIGAFLIWFSNLEHSLDYEIVDLIGVGSHDDGYKLIKYLEVSDKIKIFYDLFVVRVLNGEKRKKQKMVRLEQLRKKLETLSILRNKIAHAKWYTLDKEGYVRVDIKTSREDGFIKFRKFKISPAVIKNGTKEAKNLAEKLGTFSESIW